MRTKRRTFTWEVRCYDQRFSDMELINVTLSVTNEPLDPIVDSIGEHVNIIHTEEPWTDEDVETTRYFITIVIEESIKNMLFVYLQEKGFQEV